MHNHKIALVFLAAMLLVRCTDKYATNIDITYKWINQSGEDVLIYGDCGFDGETVALDINSLIIKNNDSITIKSTNRHIEGIKNPSIDNLDIFPSSCFAVYGDSVKCEYGAFTGIRDIGNYETAKETKKNQFYLVYRFTPETMAEASECQ